MHIGARAGEQNAVDGIKERADVGDLRRAGENEGQGTGGLGDRAQIALTYTLGGKFTLHQVQASNHSDDWFFAGGHLTTSAAALQKSRPEYHCVTVARRSLKR